MDDNLSLVLIAVVNVIGTVIIAWLTRSDRKRKRSAGCNKSGSGEEEP